MKKESIHEIYLRCKRLMELKKFIAEHKEEIIEKQPLTDTPIIEIPPKSPTFSG